jgi:hypothetical protein
MECRRHPGAPSVGYCSNCHAFVCRECAAIERPICCADCTLIWVRQQMREITGLLRNAILAGVGTLIGLEMLFSFWIPGLAGVVAALLISYFIAAFLIQGPIGVAMAPFTALRKIRELLRLKDRESKVVAIRMADSATAVGIK